MLATVFSMMRLTIDVNHQIIQEDVSRSTPSQATSGLLRSSSLEAHTCSIHNLQVLVLLQIVVIQYIMDKAVKPSQLSSGIGSDKAKCHLKLSFSL